MTERKGAALYLAVAFGFSWSLAALLFILGKAGLVHPLLRLAVFSLFMLGPALGAFVAQRARGEKVLQPLGVKFAPNRWWLLAWLAPPVYAVVTGLVSLSLPGVTLSLDFTGLIDRLAPGLSPEQLQHATAQLHAFPAPALVSLMLGQALVAGISINGLFALGEELGWRGFLFSRPLANGPWARAAVVGFIWGVWHAPIILQGHNYPQHPVVGVAMMVAWTMLLAPAFDLVRERSGSVLAASILHGTLNASAGFALLFVRGGNDLLVGVTGLAGFLVLVPVNLAIFLARRGR